LGRTDAGAAVIADMKVRLDDISSRAAAAPTRPRLLLVEWIEPPMAGGNWMPELVAIAGGVNLLSEPGKHSSWITWENIRDADPEVIVVCPCGFDIGRAEGDMETLTARAGWNDLRAVKSGRVAIADGNWYFNRPGPRLAETAEILAEILHPELFDFGWQGTGWREFSG
jgi:iron complex transport system substrate-binding protein